MSESLDIIRIPTHRSDRGRICFDLGDGITEYLTPDAMPEYVAHARGDARRWKIVALDDAVRRCGATWADVPTNEALRTRLAGATAEPPTEARVTVR